MHDAFELKGYMQDRRSHEVEPSRKKDRLVDREHGMRCEPQSERGQS